MNSTEARRRIAAVRADTAHPFFAESHPGHVRAVRDMETLYARAYPEPVVENPFDQPVPIKAPLPADPGLKHRQPGVFWQGSAPIPREDLGAAQATEGETGRQIKRVTDDALEAVGRSVDETWQRIEAAESEVDWQKVKRQTSEALRGLAEFLKHLQAAQSDDVPIGVPDPEDIESEMSPEQQQQKELMKKLRQHDRFLRE